MIKLAATLRLKPMKQLFLIRKPKVCLRIFINQFTADLKQSRMIKVRTPHVSSHFFYKYLGIARSKQEKRIKEVGNAPVLQMI